jgi:hypothetical protein
MRVKLTDTGIRSYRPRAKAYSIGDAACPGLCIRITPKGVKSFAYAYRCPRTDKTIWVTFGRYPDVSLAKARKLTNDARSAVANGGTPLTVAEHGAGSIENVSLEHLRAIRRELGSLRSDVAAIKASLARIFRTSARKENS